MNTRDELKGERQRLAAATEAILRDYQDGQMDLDDIIEALRPIRMRMRWIDWQLSKSEELRPQVETSS